MTPLADGQLARRGPLLAPLRRTAIRFRPAVLAGALWALVAARLVRYHLKRFGVRTRVLLPPAWMGPRSGRGVLAALRRLEPTCLERALVLQAWLACQGDPRDVVIGVPPEGMSEKPAHAWVDGLDSGSPAIYVELHRIPPPSVPATRRGQGIIGSQRQRPAQE